MATTKKRSGAPTKRTSASTKRTSASTAVPKKGRSDGGAGEVAAFLSSLDHSRKAEIEMLRKIVLGVDRRIEESIKWNAPSFSIGEHFATFKLRPGDVVQIVLHTGAKAKAPAAPMAIDDPTGMLKWAANDRCVVTFADHADVRAKRSALTTILKQWIARL